MKQKNDAGACLCVILICCTCFVCLGLLRILLKFYEKMMYGCFIFNGWFESVTIENGMSGLMIMLYHI